MKAKKKPSLIPYELRKMIGSPGVSVLFLLYAAILAASVLFPQFRNSYLHLQKAELLLLWAFGGILPAFVTLTLILGISPSFAGDIQSRTKEEFSTCTRGRDALCEARSTAVFLFTTLVNLAYQGITALAGLVRGQSPDWQAEIKTVYPGSKFSLTVGTYCALAILLIFSGSMVVAALTAYVSSRSKNATAPCAAAALFWASEYVFQKLGGENPVSNYLYHINVCKAMNPVIALFPGRLAPFDSPVGAIEIMLICFGVTVGLLLWRSAHWRRNLI